MLPSSENSILTRDPAECRRSTDDRTPRPAPDHTGPRSGSSRAVEYLNLDWIFASWSGFDVHQTGHGHALSVSGWPVLVNLDQMKDTVKAN